MQLVSPPSDAVSDVLRSFSVRSTIFCVSELRAPWALRVEGEPAAKFHLALEGSAVLSCQAEQVALDAGDLVVLPHGTEHTLADERTTPAVALEQLLAEHSSNGGTRLRFGGSGRLTRLLCGGFALAEALPGSTLSRFPDVMRVTHAGTTTPWLEPVLTELKAEAENNAPGADAIVAKIADVFLTQALRDWLLEGERGEIADPRLIRDEPIAKAVAALNERASERWSLDRLANHVGLSRTALTIKFRERVGQTPMRYLTKVRLGRAAELLAVGRLSVDEIARRSGYHDVAAFAKAFKREFGSAPGAYRQTAHEPPRIEISHSSSEMARSASGPARGPAH